MGQAPQSNSWAGTSSCGRCPSGRTLPTSSAVSASWVAHRPGVASVILGATRPEQLEENLAALSFDLPAELRARLDAASAPAPAFPYIFFGSEVQGSIHAGAKVGTKPPGYDPTVQDAGAGVA